MDNSTLQWLRSLDSPFGQPDNKKVRWAILNSPQTLNRLRSIWGKVKNTKILWRLNVFLVLDDMAGHPQQQADNTRPKLEKAIRFLPSEAMTHLIIAFPDLVRYKQTRSATHETLLH